MSELIAWTLVIKNNEILLLKKLADREWTLIGGHVEHNESLKMAAVREVNEEVDISIQEENLNMLCLIDRKLKDTYKFHIFFQTNIWQGTPKNNEPDIHSDMKWYQLNDLPQDLGPLAAAAINSLSTKQLYYFFSN